MVKSRHIGDGHPTFNRNPYNGYISPYYWVDEFIPYYMEIMGVDRPWHIKQASRKNDPTKKPPGVHELPGNNFTQQWTEGCEGRGVDGVDVWYSVHFFGMGFPW